MKRQNKQISKAYDKLCDEAIRFVEVEARRILAKHTNLDEFIIAMGTSFFTVKGDDDLMYSVSMDYSCRDAEYIPKYLRPMADFIVEWDDALNLTGAGFRFTADGPKVESW